MIKKIGSKNEFAIEYSVSRREPYLMGHFCFWIAGMAVGYFQEETMLSSIQNALSALKNRINETQNPEFTEKSAQEVYSLVYSGEIDNGKYLLNLGESFDDFSFFMFKEDDSVNLVWKLHEQPFFDYPDYTMGVNCKKIPISLFFSIVESFIMEVT